MAKSTPTGTSAQIRCPSCKKICGSKSSLTAHIRKEHPNEQGTTELDAKWGSMAPLAGGAWRPDRPLRVAPSGVPSIDWAIGIGGLPLGTIAEIFGPAGSGKTLTALTFSAHAQQQGGIAGYVDAEHRLQPTFAALVPHLNLNSLRYSEPDGGEAALNITKDYISTGLYDIWTVDSVHGCVPKALRKKAIGDDTMAELAKLMSAACQVLDPIIAETSTVCIFVNHVKSKPGVQYGRDWSKPGGTALDYYASVQMRVQPFAIWTNKEHRKIGHSVRVKIENSKVAAPYASAEYDVFYRHDKIHVTDPKTPEQRMRNGQVVQPGIDIGSCWFSVAKEADVIDIDGAGRVYHKESGETFGTRRDTTEYLEQDSALRREIHELVYGAYAQKARKAVEAAAA